MRIAVAVPTLDPGAVHRQRLDAVVTALGRSHDVERFGESARVREGDVTHYLRFDACHRAAPFDTALYPVGRDFRLYEPAIYLARRFPGLVWLLDSVPHHLIVGGVAQRGRWDAYLELMESEFGDAGWRAAATVAWGWGTRALYRCFDPAARELARQPGLVTTSATISGDVGRFAGDVTAVPLPAVHADSTATRRGVVVIAPDLGRPVPGLSALRELRRRHPAVPIRFCVPQNVYEDAVSGLAAQIGIADDLRWHLSPDAAALSALVDRAAVIVAETTDPGVSDRSLVERGMAGGALAIVPGVPAWEEIPPGAAVRLDAGRGFGISLAAALVLAVEDRELAAAVAAAGRDWAVGRPSAELVATALDAPLRDSAKIASAVPARWRARQAWETVAATLDVRAVPASASPATRDLIVSRVHAAAAGLRRLDDSS